jgi:hypothetical protein
MIKATQPVTRFVGDGLASNFGPNEGNWSGGAKGDRALSPREWAIGWGTLLRAEGMSNGAGSEQLQEAEIAGPDDGLEVSDATRTADLACARAADRLLSRSASTQAAPNDPNVCDASAGHGRPGRRPCSAPRLPWITSGAAAGSDATSLKSPRSFDTPRRTSILTTRVSGMGISWEHAQDPQSVSGATGLGLGDMAAQMCPQPAQPEIKPIRDLNDLEQLAGSERGEGDCPGARVTALCSSRFEAPSYRLIRSAVSSEAKRTETHDPEISKDVETPGDTRGAVVAVEGTPVRQVDSESYGERRASPQIDLQSARISTPEVDALRSSSDKSDGARQLTQPLRVGDPHYSVNSVSGRHSSALAANVSQVDQTSAVSSTLQDGFASGIYRGFSIGADGTVTATFKNGQKLNVGQLALGNVVNLQGLKALGNGEFETTLASGSATIGVSGTSGLGTMQGGALEGSNVNISAEFSNLIIAQRAFEANSKAITTFDTVTQETINMIH